MKRKQKRRERHETILREGTIEGLKGMYIIGAFDKLMKEKSIVNKKDGNPYRYRYAFPKEVREDFRWVSKHFAIIGMSVEEDETRELLKILFKMGEDPTLDIIVKNIVKMSKENTNEITKVEDTESEQSE